MRFDLGNDAKITLHNVAVVAGSANITPSAGIDMSGFESVSFLVPWGAITGSGVQSLEAHASSDDGVADGYSALLGSNVTVDDDDDNQITVLTVHRPSKTWVKCIVNRATQNSAIGGIIAIQYNGSKKRPITQPATVSGVETHITPAEGTA